MLEYLEKLAEDREWQKVIEYSEQMLLKPENTSWDLMVIYTRLCQARFETDEFYGAQVAGELAMKMARELEAWDYVGISALWLGVAYERLRQPDNALSVLYEYLAHIPHYKAARQHHLLVLANVGTLHMKADRLGEAINVLAKALELAMTLDDRRNAHGIRLILINAYLRTGDLAQVPVLLVKCGHYLRHNPSVVSHGRSLMTYLHYRVEYAVATNRLERAVLVAQRAIRIAKLPEAADPVLHIHDLLARIYERQGYLSAALREGIRARTVAIEARRFDLEYKMTEYIYGLLSAYPDLTEQIDINGERED